MKPFQPDPGSSSLRLLATSTSAAVALPTTTERGPRTLRVTVELSSDVHATAPTGRTWIAFGGSGVVVAIPATTPTAANGILCPSRVPCFFEIGEGVTHVAIITDGAANNVVSMTVGSGGG